MALRLTWFSSLTISRALRTDYGWRVEWSDDRVTKITIASIETPDGTTTVKTIRWAA